MVNFNNAKNGNDVCTDLIISVFFQSFSDENLAANLVRNRWILKAGYIPGHHVLMKGLPRWHKW